MKTTTKTNNTNLSKVNLAPTSYNFSGIAYAGNRYSFSADTLLDLAEKVLGYFYHELLENEILNTTGKTHDDFLNG